MSKYYNVKGYSVRVSDHEPNVGLRGGSDIYIWTKSVDGKKLNILQQVKRICERYEDLQVGDFNEILGRKTKKGLRDEYRIVDIWFSDVEGNKYLIADLKKNAKVFAPHNLNAAQKESWVKYVEKKLQTL